MNFGYVIQEDEVDSTKNLGRLIYSIKSHFQLKVAAVAITEEV